MQKARPSEVTPVAEGPGLPADLHPDPRPDDSLETLISDVLGAVLSLEYGAVTTSVQGGRVVQLERHEKRRLAKPGANKGVNKAGANKSDSPKTEAAQRFN